MIKRLSCLILSFIAFFSCFMFGSCFEADAADDTMEKLYSLVRQFPEDKYWNHMGSDENNPDGYTDTPCESHRNCSFLPGECCCNSFDNAIQCMGYAYKIAYEIVGVSARQFSKVTTLSASELRVGDVIRYNGHSVCVTGVKGTKISFTDNNYTGLCQIRWGQMDISSIKNFNYVLHYEGNNRKNTDLDFYLDVPEETPATEKREIWKMSSDNLNVRKKASTDAKIVGKITGGSQFYVYQKKVVGDYLWAKVKSGSVEGWAVLNYATYVKGEYETPEISDPQKYYDTSEITFQWNEVSGAAKYKIRLYDENKKTVKTYTVKSNKKTVTVPAEGTYYVRVFALNDMCPTWKIKSDLIKFEIGKTEKVSVEKIEMKSSLSLSVSETYALVAEIQTSDVTDKELKWKSSNKNVAKVSSDGTVTAVSCGDAAITCTSGDGTVSAKCKVSVKPNAPKDFKQVRSETTTGEIKLTWSKVAEAEGYRVYLYNTESKKYVLLATTKKTSYTAKDLSEGVNYKFVVRSYVKIDGKKVMSSYATLEAATDPAKVTNIRQTASSSGTVTVSWDKVQNADVYVVYKYNTKTKKKTKVKSTSETEIKLTQKTASTVYYRVYAVTKTASGNIYSSASSVCTTVAGPAKPVAQAESTKKSQVKITWNEVSGATHYYVYRLENGKYKKIKTLTSETTSYTDKKLTSGKEYSYKVKAVTKKNGVTANGTASGAIKVTVK